MTAKEDMRKLMDQLAKEMGKEAQVVGEDGQKVVDQYTPAGKKKLSEGAQPLQEESNIEIFIAGEKTELGLLDLVNVLHAKTKVSEEIGYWDEDINLIRVIYNEIKTGEMSLDEFRRWLKDSFAR